MSKSFIATRVKARGTVRRHRQLQVREIPRGVSLKSIQRDIPNEILIDLSSAGVIIDAGATASLVSTFNLNHLVQASTTSTNAGVIDLMSAYGSFRVRKFRLTMHYTQEGSTRPSGMCLFIAPPAGVGAPSTATAFSAQPGLSAKWKIAKSMSKNGNAPSVTTLSMSSPLHKFVHEKAYLSDDNYAGTLNSSGSPTAPSTLVPAYAFQGYLDGTSWAANNGAQVFWTLEQVVELFNPRY